VPALGELCPSVGEIATQKERDDLSFKIVQNALLPILRNKIGQYDSTDLLKRFISLKLLNIFSLGHRLPAESEKPTAKRSVARTCNISEAKATKCCF
jgi:hypothetical protein